MSPLLILLVGIVVVVGMIVVLRINAFIALVTAALAVSLLAPGPTDQKVARIAEAFGQTAGSIAIVIGMAAVVGQCMMASGAADRIVRAFLGALGERRAGTALAGSGFVLSIPVFFDTVFYLLVPLARSMFRRTGRNYLKSLMAISAGAAVTHTLVPPTPGPMVIADTLKVDLGVMILMGITVGLPAAAVGLAFAAWLDRRMPIEMRPLAGAAEPEQLPDTALPSLGVSLLPIVLPVLLISTHTIVSRLALGAPDGSAILQARQWTALFGNPNFALMASAAVALLVYIRQRRATREQTATTVETALMSAGVIILITAGGGAFGAMLRAAEIGPAIQNMFAGRAGGPDFPMLFLAFFISSLLKFAQGSSTVAMITAAGMVSAMLDPASLSYHPVYLAIAIGSGSLVGSWMNDSGFWIYAKMGGLLETETLRSWTVLLIILGSTAMAVNVLLAMVMPMAPGPGGAGGPATPGAQQVPGIERLEPALDELVAPDATVEILAEGYEWSEGPVWVKDGGFLLFSDIPQNAIYRWKEGEGAGLYLRPAGYTGPEERGGESGSNGLTIDRDGHLVLAQHGDRRIARMEAPTGDPRPSFVTLADRYDGARFNSPNDLVFHSNGDLYFTDPAYGLPKGWDDPARDMDYAGVFRLARDGTVTLLTREMTRPNGLAFSPDERRLYVAQSDSGAAIWRVFDVAADGALGPGRILFDATPMVKTRRGLPDGLKIDTRGNLFATGPGGVLILTPDGRHLGTILTGQATSNVAFGDDGQSLYITADMYLMRVRLKTTGLGF